MRIILIANPEGHVKMLLSEAFSQGETAGPAMQSSLFGDSDGVGPISQVQADKVLSPVYGPLSSCVLAAWQDLQGRRHSKDESFRSMTEPHCAVWMNWETTRWAKQFFAADNAYQVQFGEVRQVFFLNCPCGIALRFKKVNRITDADGFEYLQFNCDTDSQLHNDYWSERHIDGFPDAHRLLFAYEFCDLITAIKLYLGSPTCDGRFRWIHPISDHGAGGLAIAETPPTDGGDDQTGRRFRIVHDDAKERTDNA